MAQHNVTLISPENVEAQQQRSTGEERSGPGCGIAPLKARGGRLGHHNCDDLRWRRPWGVRQHWTSLAGFCFIRGLRFPAALSVRFSLAMSISYLD